MFLFIILILELLIHRPVVDWRPVQGVPRFSPDDRWDRLQPPRDPTNGLKRV